LKKNKKRGGRLDSNVFVYFFLSSRNTAIAIPARMAIVEPARYVSVIGAGVGVGSGAT
jgi:hypothetical protein